MQSCDSKTQHVGMSTSHLATPSAGQHTSVLTGASLGPRRPVNTISTTRGSSPVTWNRARLASGSAALLSWSLGLPGPPPRLRLELIITASPSDAKSSSTSSVRLWKWGVVSPRWRSFTPLLPAGEGHRGIVPRSSLSCSSRFAGSIRAQHVVNTPHLACVEPSSQQDYLLPQQWYCLCFPPALEQS